MSDVDTLIARYGLRPLPREGGWYSQTWHGPLTSTDRGPCPAGTCILYLLAGAEFSALHRLPDDEMWHFHAGDPVELFRLDPATGDGGWIRLGPEVLATDVPQAMVPVEWWQGARLAAGGRWALLGCTMVPGYEDADFELGTRAAMLAAFPRWTEAVRALTHAP